MCMPLKASILVLEVVGRNRADSPGSVEELECESSVWSSFRKCVVKYCLA